MLYLDKDLVEKSKELGFNLSKTFENHLKRLMTQFSTGNSVNNFNSTENKVPVVGLPGFEPESIKLKETYLKKNGNCETSRLMSATLYCYEQ